MTAAHAKTLKALLRARFGADTWLTLSAEIQDVLRERKRDALPPTCSPSPHPPMPSANGRTRTTCTPTTCSTSRWARASSRAA